MTVAGCGSVSCDRAYGAQPGTDDGTDVRLRLESGESTTPGDEAARRLTLKGFCLDLATKQLLCEDEVVALTPKAFTVLRGLVEDGGQLVTKEALPPFGKKVRRRVDVG
jgi:DNA-binding response OmpR family regulator